MVLNGWSHELRGVPQGHEIWAAVWKPFREKVKKILWQVVHRIPTTLHYIGRRTTRRDEDGEVIPFRRDDPMWWCKRCIAGCHEDLLHCLWSCPDSVVVWEWVRRVMEEVSSRKSRRFEFGAV